MTEADHGQALRYRFGPWRFDAETGDLGNGPDNTRLEPKVAQLLGFFLKNQHTLVSRADLIDAVWEGRIVSDDAINRCVSILRQTLTPNDKNAFIETVVRRGFISHFPPPDETVPGTTLPLPPRGTQRLILLCLVLLLAGTVAWQMLRTPGNPARETGPTAPPVIAVLPFQAAGHDDDSSLFAMGMHDDLLTRLAQVDSLRVISRTSVAEYGEGTHNIREIGQALGADAVLEGSVQRQGDRLRIHAQLIDAHNDQHLWAQQYDRELRPEALFEVQAEISRSIAGALRATLSEADVHDLELLPTNNMAAYRAYHQAMAIRDQRGLMTPQYRSSLEQAVALDPDFVRAWVELAGLIALNNFSFGNEEDIGTIEQILERVQRLAPDSGDYLMAQTYYVYYVLRDFPRAYQLIRQAEAARPGDVRVLELKSWIQRRVDEFTERTETLRQIRSLDPLNPIWSRYVVKNLILLHRYDEAQREIEAAPADLELLSQQSVLRLREDRDFKRLLNELRALQVEFDSNEDIVGLWRWHIAARDYAGALEVLAIEAMQAIPHDHWLRPDFYGTPIPEVITLWLIGDEARLQPVLSDAQAQLHASLAGGTQHPYLSGYLSAAFVAAAAGQAQEAEQQVRAWLRLSERDLIEQAVDRVYACRALGMAGAAQSAVECIRESLKEPSQAMPFVEAWLPHYDQIRDTPEFTALLAELGEGQDFSERLP